VHQVDPAVQVYDPGNPGGQGEQRP
jgi:formate dehydrogenase iron-sulfur subunit